jgi:hypothetical protein
MWPRYAAGAPIVAQMRVQLLAVCAALLCVGLATACERTVPGTVARTTQPGPAATTTTRSPTTTPRTPGRTPGPTTTPRTPTTPTSPTSEVPAPANAKTMKCDEYVELDEATQQAVIRAILADENSVFPKENDDLAKTIVDGICQFLPDSTVSEVLVGTPP